MNPYSPRSLSAGAPRNHIISYFVSYITSHHATGGVDPTGGKGGIIDKFSTGRRRLKENIAQKTGKEAADNSEFEERSQRVADLREKV